MKELNISSEDLEQLGFKKEKISQFLNSKTLDKKIQLLQEQRNNLLENIHFQEHQINTLDYFTFKINNLAV